MRKLISFILAIIIVLLVVDLCFDIKETLVPSFKGNEEILKISAKKMWAEFEADEETARKYYDGKTVRITGKVAEKTENFLNKPCILLENGVDSIPDGIFCFLANAEDLNFCEVESEITIIGTCEFGIEIYGDGIWICLYNSRVIYN